MCVLIDGHGYDFHEDLLEHGFAGGREAANRLIIEIGNFVQKFQDSKSWDIKAQIYLDVKALLRRCQHLDISTNEESLRDFMCGFVQAEGGPLLDIIDVGGNPSQKIEGSLLRLLVGLANVLLDISGSLHLFANNVHCRRIFFGCCHDEAYAMLLQRYVANPVVAPRITLLASSNHQDSFDSLPFDMIGLPQVFRPSSFSATDNSTMEDGDFFPRSAPVKSRSPSDRVRTASPHTATTSFGSIPKWQEEAIAKWQGEANGHGFHRRLSNPQRNGVRSKEPVLLNIHDERVDPQPKEEDPESKEMVQARMAEKKYCTFFHLLDSCNSERMGKTCNFRHGPRLNEQELVILQNIARRLPCAVGSTCRDPVCVFGHSCQNQPGCRYGARCYLAKFHNVDKTAVRVWHPRRVYRSV